MTATWIATAIAWARTTVFRIAFYGLSVLIVGSFPVSTLFGMRATIAHASLWSRTQTWLAWAILGIRVVEQGTRPPGAVLYAAKHQAMFEALDLQWRLGGPAVVIKEELARIPVWGWAARQYGSLVVDRAGSAAALRQMLREANAATAGGRSILIFAEGSRVRPGERPPLKSGFAGLYRLLNLPVVPIALDTGRLWPRHGPKRPGTITIRYGDVIPPGLPRAELEARVHAAINALEG